MIRIAYLAFTAALLISATAFHVFSYYHAVPSWALAMATLMVVIVCIPSIVLFVQIRRQGPSVDLWQRFWRATLERCPRWVSGSMTVSVVLIWATGASSAFFHKPKITFQTALFLLPATVAFSYAVTLWRTHDQTA